MSGPGAGWIETGGKGPVRAWAKVGNRARAVAKKAEAVFMHSPLIV